MSMTTTASKPEAQGGGEIALKTDQRQLALRNLFETDRFQSSLRQALPRHMDPKRMIRVVLSALTQTPDLLECTPESVMLSVMRAAAMGLEPDGGPLGQGYLVPFNTKVRVGGRDQWVKVCQFIPGYRGLVKLARNSGEVADVWAEVVYEADKFEYELGLNQTLVHKRNDEAADPGPMKYAYAVARFRDGERKFVVMNRREIEQVRKVNRASNGELSPWNQWPAEMWKKTAVRRLCKLLPLSVEMQSQIAAEDDVQLDLSGLGAIDVPQPQHLAIEGTSEPANDGPTLEPDPQASDFWPQVVEQLDKAKSHSDIDAIDNDFRERFAIQGDDDMRMSQLCDEARDRIGKGKKSSGKLID